MKASVKATGEKAAEKAAETKTAVKEAVEKVEEKAAEVKEEVKSEEKKVAAKAEEAKETVKKSAKKVTAKKAAEKTELVPEVFIQFQDREDVVKDVIDRAKEAYVADGHRASSIKSLQVYLKPEEAAAYYVINQKYAGKVALF